MNGDRTTPKTPKVERAGNAASVDSNPFGDTQTPSEAAFERVLSQVASVPRPSLLQEGALVGEYRIVKPLGKGTFGTVYHGAHTVIGKQAALKVLNSEFSEDSHMVERFITEARAVNRIAHPNIVDIFGFGVLPDGRKYCVMELLEGETLAAYLKAHGRCPWPEVARILTQIAAALDAAHDHQIVHRDLKPDNVFMSRRPAAPGGSEHSIIKLLDFGIARVADASQSGPGTASGVVLGTPAYMSPEQCRGQRVDRRTDVYALGVVAFEMLTGELPFSGQNALQFVWQHNNDPPPTPSSLNPELPPAVDVALLHLLAKAPDERPERASEGIAELVQALGQQSALSSASLIPRRTPQRRAPWRWVVAGSLLAGILAGVLWLGAGKRTASGPPAALSAEPPAPKPQPSPAAAAPSAIAQPALAAPSTAAIAAPSASARLPATKKPRGGKPGAVHELEY